MSTSVVPSSTASRLAAWPDYTWVTWLPDALEAADVPYVQHPGWRHRGRPRSVGRFVPLAVMWHHDASAPGPSPDMARFIATTGRPDEGIPAPLANVWVCAGCRGRHEPGTWHLLAAGRANHAGTGAGWGVIRRDQGNADALGIEVDHTTGEAWNPTLLHNLRKGTAAVLVRLGADPADALAGHRDYAPGRKVDPDGLDLDVDRAVVARMMTRLRHPSHGSGPRPLEPFPGHVFAEGKAHRAVTSLERWLQACGYLGRDVTPAPLFDARTRSAVRRFQRATPALAGMPDGIPGPVTWRLVQEAARHARAGR